MCTPLGSCGAYAEINRVWVFTPVPWRRGSRLKSFYFCCVFVSQAEKNNFMFFMDGWIPTDVKFILSHKLCVCVPPE